MPDLDTIGRWTTYGAVVIIAAILVTSYAIAAAHASLETGIRMWVEYAILSAVALISAVIYFFLVRDCYKNNRKEPHVN